MEATTRKYMSHFMPYMPLEASDLADGIFVSSVGRSWNLKGPVAVECHLLQRSRHWERPGEQVKKRFVQGYAGVIVVCTTPQDERILRQGFSKDPELKAKLEASDIEIYVFKSPSGNGSKRPN